MKKVKAFLFLITFSILLFGCEKTPETEINDALSSKSEYNENTEETNDASSSKYEISGMYIDDDKDKLFIIAINYHGINYINETEEKKLFSETAKKSFELFKLAEDNADAFVMDAENYRINEYTSDPDLHGRPKYFENNLNYPGEIDWIVNPK